MENINRVDKKINMYWILLFSMFFLIYPDYFQSITFLNIISTFVLGIMFLIVFSINILQKRMNFFIFLTFLYLLWRSYTSYFLNDGVLDIVNNFRIINIVLLINICIKKYPKALLSSMASLFSIYIILNFLTLIVFSDGLTKTSLGSEIWFLGIANQFGYFLIPAISIIMLNSWFKYNKITVLTWLYSCIALLSVMIVWSATAIVSLIIVIIISYILQSKNIGKLINFNLLLMVYGVFWFVLVKFNSITIFQKVIVDLLEKDLTLSYRTEIWQSVFEELPKSIYYGFGINSEVRAGIVTDFAAHNMILQILLDSGIIGLFLFISCLFYVGNKKSRFKSYYGTNLLLVSVFGILIGGLAESYRINYLFLLLTLIYNVKYITKSFEIKVKQ